MTALLIIYFAVNSSLSDAGTGIICKLGVTVDIPPVVHVGLHVYLSAYRGVPFVYLTPDANNVTTERL